MKNEKDLIIDGYQEVVDPIIVWYRNGCTSGLTLEQAERRFIELPQAKQKKLKEEYQGVLESQKSSCYAPPFAG